MQDPARKQFEKAFGKTIPATFKKGIIAKLNTDLGTADVIIVGSNQTVLKNLPLSSAIDIYDIRLNDKCRVDMFDESNPQDSVVAYTYGRKKRGT